jgi:1A family penicillin-binding protein
MAAKKPITNKRSSPKRARRSQTKTIKIRHKSAVIFQSSFSALKTLQETAKIIAGDLQQQFRSLKITLRQTQLTLSAVAAQKKEIFSKAYQNKVDQITAERKSTLRQKQALEKKLRQQQQKVLHEHAQILKQKQKIKEKKLQREQLQAITFAQRLPVPLRFLYLEVVHPSIYVFRHHPFLSFGSIFFSLLILLSAYLVYDLAFKDLPSVTELTARKQILTTKILDRNGKLLYSIYKDENRTLIPLSQVPANMRNATIAIEDKDFYSHHGFSVRGIARALNEDLKGEQLQGGSTITQQLVKNTLLSPERTFKRKVREILLSFMMEGTYEKDEILEMYFNEIPYGGSTYGVEEAAQRYFGKSAHQLTLAESSFLAGLPAAPSVYSPFGATPEYAYMRQREVLRRMVEDGYITQEQADATKNEVLTFQEDTTNIKAPHFVMYIRNLLAQQYGEEVLSQGGLEVRTTLDLDTQNQTQKIVTDEMVSLARLRINNGAAMVTNPKSGEILAMVGSKNYFDFKHDGQVNVTLRPRQPGSSIKPLTYALAFEQGRNPSSMILDEPISFSSPGSPPYVPKNYDGKFHGNVSLRQALASSYNIPAVKTLASVGINTMIDKGQEIGITTWEDRKRFGLALTLGAGEVMMADITKLYGTFANYGNTVELDPFLEIKNSHGETMYRNTCALDNQGCPSRRTFSAKTAYQITNVLSDNNARTPAFGPRSVLHIPGQQVAVKTGTTNNLRDNWTIGYTTDRVVAVWVGNNDNQAMSYVASGITGASPIWNKIIRTQLDDAHPHVFPTPEGLIKVKICARTGTLPCTGCPSVVEELYIPGTEPTQACNPAQFIQPSPNPNATPKPGGKILDGVTITR